jgi:DMSO/TMAO reductase YedYZ molybdopterin-dependent catalytic subunit
VVATSPRESSALAGAIAAAVAAVGMLAMGLATEQPSVAETVAEAIAARTPVTLIEGMTSTFGSSAKRLLLAAVLLGEIGLGTILAIEYGRRGAGRLEGIGLLAGTIAVAGVVGLPMLGAGVMGATSRAGVGATSASLVLTAILFAAAYAGTARFLNPSGTFAKEDAASRRALIRRASMTAVGVFLGVGLFQWAARRLTPEEPGATPSSEAAMAKAAIAESGDLVRAIAQGVPGLSPEITPNDRFYVVSKNVFSDPAVSEQAWRLEVSGLVDRPTTFTYTQVREMPASKQYFTLQCISNEVGGSLIGNAEWRGVPLGDVLRQVGVRPAAADVVLRAADDYSDSIPIAKALEPATMLAFEMNGEILPKAHGFPVRLLVPDIYGMKNVKWVTKIEVVEYDFTGYWQTRGWNDVATVNTSSRIDLPKNRSNLRTGENYVGGIALAGSRGIQRVEVSIDEGRTWGLASIKPALGPNTWVLWLFGYDLPAGPPDEHRIIVRATDGTGSVQTAMVQEALPSGATGHHAVVVRTV